MLAGRHLHRRRRRRRSCAKGAGGEARDRVAAGAQHNRGDPAPATFLLCGGAGGRGPYPSINHGLTQSQHNPTTSGAVRASRLPACLDNGQRVDPLKVIQPLQPFCPRVQGAGTQNQQFKGTLHGFFSLDAPGGQAGDRQGRSRCAVRFRRAGAPLQSERVVDRAGHRRRVHPAGQAAGQRLARAHAPRPQGRGHGALFGQSSPRSGGRLRALAMHPVQLRTTARGARHAASTKLLPEGERRLPRVRRTRWSIPPITR